MCTVQFTSTFICFITSEMVTCFNKIATDSECRVVVLSGAGKIFTAGKIDMYFQQFNFLTFASLSSLPLYIEHFYVGLLKSLFLDKGFLQYIIMS